MKRPLPKAGAPLSRMMSVEELASLPAGALKIKATEQECADLATVNHLPGVSRLEANLIVRPEGRGFFVTGEVRGRIRQNCVVTLEDFESDFAEPVEVRYMPTPVAPRTRGGKGAPKAPPKAPPLPEDGEDDPPELFENDHIDLGETVAEFFALGLDPYPRKPGVAFGAVEVTEEGLKPVAEGPSRDDNPFAALAGLKGGKPGKPK